MGELERSKTELNSEALTFLPRQGGRLDCGWGATVAWLENGTPKFAGQGLTIASWARKVETTTLHFQFQPSHLQAYKLLLRQQTPRRSTTLLSLAQHLDGF